MAKKKSHKIYFPFCLFKAVPMSGGIEEQKKKENWLLDTVYITHVSANKVIWPLSTLLATQNRDH